VDADWAGDTDWDADTRRSHTGYILMMLVAGSIFGPLSQNHFSESELKNGQISKSSFVFQVIQVISSAKFFSAEEVDLSFISST